MLQKRTSILTYDKVQIKIKLIRSDKATKIYWEDVRIVNIFLPNVSTPNFVKQIQMGFKGLDTSNTIIEVDFNFLVPLLE